MTASDLRPLFVFGTLRRGARNHHLLAGRYERCFPARLPGFERHQPLMIRRKSGRQVRGELFFFSPELYEQVMRDCDRLEEIPPGKQFGWQYRRLLVRVLTPVGSQLAWAYVRTQTTTMVPRSS